MPKPDFTFKLTDDGMVVSVYPENEKAEAYWNTVIAPKTNGTGKFFKPKFKAFQEELTQQGFTIAPVTADEAQITDEELLKELEIQYKT